MRKAGASIVSACEGGCCTNTRTFYLDEIERRVLAGLEAQLKDPRGIERFLKTYTEERRRLAAAEEAKRHRKELCWAR
jgi:site-specific DNA recombinase